MRSWRSRGGILVTSMWSTLPGDRWIMAVRMRRTVGRRSMAAHLSASSSSISSPRSDMRADPNTLSGASTPDRFRRLPVRRNEPPRTLPLQFGSSGTIPSILSSDLSAIALPLSPCPSHKSWQIQKNAKKSYLQPNTLLCLFSNSLNENLMGLRIPNLQDEEVAHDLINP